MRKTFALDEGELTLSYPAELSPASSLDMANRIEILLRGFKRPCGYQAARGVRSDDVVDERGYQLRPPDSFSRCGCCLATCRTPLTGINWPGAESTILERRDEVPGSSRPYSPSTLIEYRIQRR